MSMEGKDRGSRIIRLVLIAFVLATCVKVWLEPTGFNQTAHAQALNPAGQRQAIADEASKTNMLLANILKTLESGTLNVRVKGADEQTRRTLLPPGKARGSSTAEN